MLYLIFFLKDFKLLKLLQVSHFKIVINGLIFFHNKIQMIRNHMNKNYHLIDIHIKSIYIYIYINTI